MVIDSIAATIIVIKIKIYNFDSINMDQIQIDATIDIPTTTTNNNNNNTDTTTYNNNNNTQLLFSSSSNDGKNTIIIGGSVP